MIPKHDETLRLRQKSARREAILESVRTLILEVGYDAVTMDMVADRAKITKPTLYVYMKNKEQMILAAYLRVLELSSATREGLDAIDSPLERLSTIVRRVLDVNFAQPDSLYAWPPVQVAEHPEFVSALEKILQSLAEIVREGQEASEIAADLDPRAAVQFYVSIAGNNGLSRLSENGTLAPTELIEQLHTIILNSFRPF